MATNNNCVGCGCGPSIPEPCVTPPPVCLTPEPCTEVYDAQCVKYTGPAITCNDVVIVQTNTSVSEALNALAELTCDDACCTIPVVDVISRFDSIILCTEILDKCPYEGYLYNWMAINNGIVEDNGRVVGGIVNIDPIDNPINTWKVPNNADWKALAFELDPAAIFTPTWENIAGGKMKTISCWSIPNSGATNSSLFSSQSYKYRNQNGTFSDNNGQVSFYWSYNAETVGYAFAYNLDFDSVNLSQSIYNINYGFKLRLTRPAECNETPGTVIPNAYVDNSGNVYDGIVIGATVWTMTDLHDKKYNNDNLITYLPVDFDWETTKKGAVSFPETQNDVSIFSVGCQESKMNFQTFLNSLAIPDVEVVAGTGITVSETTVDNVTTFTISATGATPAYKVYSALISQAGTGAPTVTVLENTIGNIVWSRATGGDYRGTLTGAFTPNKTMVFASRQAGGPSAGYMFASRLSNDAVFMTSGSVVGGPGDDYISEASIEIRVYP
jgi:uncharacterized protein (TIGR02145 family)